MPTLKRHRGVLAYDVQGEGEALVMLRGLGRSVKHWLGYERVLAKHFKVVTMDLRGIGRTTVPWGWTTSLFDVADDVVAILDHLNIQQAHILGVSLGGMVTLAMGLSYPERCHSLVTVNTSIAGMGTLRITPRAVRTLAKAVSLRPDKIHAALADVLSGADFPEERRLEVIDAYRQIADDDGLYAATVVKQLLSAARFHIKGKLKYMQVPTLVVYGTDDRFVPHINSRKVAQMLPNAKLVAIHGGGHELTLDKGDELSTVLVGWVRDLEYLRPTRSVAD